MLPSDVLAHQCSDLSVYFDFVAVVCTFDLRS